MDSTSPLKVSCAIWHQDISGRSFRSCKFPAHPKDAWLDWDLGNWEAKSTPWILCHVPQTIPKTIFTVTGHNILMNEATAISEYLCHKGVYALQQGLGMWHMQNEHPHECPTSITLPLLACLLPMRSVQPLPQVSDAQAPSHSSYEATFFYCYMIQFWYLLAHCRAVDRGQHGHSDQSAASCDALCVLTHVYHSQQFSAIFVTVTLL